MNQIIYFTQDINRLLGKNKARLVHIWMSRAFWGLFIYRFERSLYLLFGISYQYLRIILLPVLYILQAYSNIEIHYKANIQGGLIILHPSVGVVVSGLSQIGKNLTLTGGNIIGAKPGSKPGDIVIGDHCTLGANATIIGPIKLTDRILVGASACVVQDCLVPDSVLVGVPAKPIISNNA